MNWKRRKSLLMATGALATSLISLRPAKAQAIYAETILRGVEVLQPTSVTVGNVAVGQSQNFDIKYSAGGTCHVIVGDVAITGRDVNDFKIVSAGHEAFWRNPPLVVTVQFTPSHPGLESASIDMKLHTVERCGIRIQPKELIGFGVGGQSQVYRPQPPVNPVQPPPRPEVYIFIEGAQTSSNNPNAPVRVYLNKVAINSDGQSLNGKYDVLGEGNTSNVKYATHNDKNKIEDYIQTLPQDTEVYLIGHSWGGYVATQIAANPKVRKINGLLTIDPVNRNFDSSAPSDRNRPPAETDRRRLFRDAHDRVGVWIDVDATLDDSSANSGQWDRSSDRVANIGGDWGVEPKLYGAQLLLNNIAHHADFTAMMRQVQLKIIQPARQQPSLPPGP